MPERALLWAALAAYLAACVIGLAPRIVPRAVPRLASRHASRLQLGTGTQGSGEDNLAALAWMSAGVALLTASLALRWVRLGHGPFTTMHEILASSLWSLSLVLTVAAWRAPLVRASLHRAAPVLMVLGTWLLLANPAPGHLPATYDTVLLYLHTIVGKLFLGLLLAAVVVAWHDASPAAEALAHRLAAFALVFDSLLLIVGAVWAQDAWGRYWGWDPLETWSFLTWLALVATLHARVTWWPSQRAQAWCYAAVFVIAFLTFFGVPYLSTSPHKGAI